MSHVTAGDPALACFAVAAPGLEPLVRDELRALRDHHPLELGESEPGGVEFRADRAGLYAANLHLRIASRVLVRIGSFHAAAFHELERHAARLPWHEFVAPGRPVEFRVTSRKSRLYHQDAIAQRLLASVGSRVPGANAAAVEGEPAQEFVVRIFRDECTVSADASGELLHRRGYRLAAAKAPLRETLAAAMVVGSGWDGTAPLVDPMCGSGTIPIEAALLARRIPPGIGRRFAFMGWPGFDEAAWEEVLRRARERILPRAPVPILGSDRDAGAVAAAAANAERAGVAEDVEWRRAAISAVAPPPGPGWIVTNPPYGVRVGERQRLRDLYAQLGNVARRCCPGWEVAFLAAHPELERQTGLELTPRFATENGGIRVRLVQGRVPPVAPGPGRPLAGEADPPSS
jgi:putative N6-adenine-specific DNA methylase